MDFLVVSECAELPKLFVTVVAVKRLLAGVNLGVVGERAGLAELFVANTALKRFLSGMNLEMIC